MMLISFIQAFFITIAVYLVNGLATQNWTVWHVPLIIWAVAWLLLMIYDVSINFIIDRFNKPDESIFRG